MKTRFELRKTALIILSVIIIGVIANAPVRADENRTLVIIHTNDLHGRLRPHMNKRISRDKPVGGMPYIASIINNIRRQHPGKTLLLDGGDVAQGSPVSNKFKGVSAIEAMNALHYDAATVGNHEFDWEISGLLKMMAKSNFPWLGANIIRTRYPRLLMRGLKPYVIKEVNGVRVGILGLTTPDTPTTTGGQKLGSIKFASPKKTALKYIPEMKRKGASLIVVLSHLGIGDDIKLAERVGSIDVIVGAHSHSAMKYPKKVRNTIIVQAGAYGSYVGVLKLKISPKTKMIKSYTAKGALIPVTHDNVKPDPEVMKIVQKYGRIIDKEMGEVVGVAAGDIEKKKKRGRTDTCLGNLITDAMRDYTGADAAILNFGGIRANIYKGNITLETLHTVLPFKNMVVGMDIPGKNLKDVLERRVWGGGVAQVSGLEYKLDLTKKIGQRVSDLKINGKPYQTDKIYRLATVDFLLSGGDKYKFKQYSNVKVHPVIRDVLKAYVKKLKAVNPPETGRVKVTAYPERRKKPRKKYRY